MITREKGKWRREGGADDGGPDSQAISLLLLPRPLSLDGKIAGNFLRKRDLPSSRPFPLSLSNLEMDCVPSTFHSLSLLLPFSTLLTHLILRRRQRADSFPYTDFFSPELHSQVLSSPLLSLENWKEPKSWTYTAGIAIGEGRGKK